MKRWVSLFCVVSLLLGPQIAMAQSSEKGVNGKSSTNRVQQQSSEQPQELMKRYAPRLIFDKSESYYPMSVEKSFPYFDREKRDDGNYSLKTKENLEDPDSTLPFFNGDLSTSKIYAYYIKRSDNVVDIVYWVFYPYNQGKKVAWWTLGNHVGDWEHVTVRLTNSSPSQVYLSAHSGGSTMGWDDAPKVGGTHPIAYVAKGSHGMYKDAGKHVYGFSLGSLIDVVDYTSDGKVWDPWNVDALSYFVSKDNGETYDSTPSWMRKDFTSTPSGKNATDPASGAIYMWGNSSDGTCFGSECELGDGPTGPSAKDDIMKNSPDNDVN
ncbi:protein of unknown function [Marininema mesophilum]|uniref:DUF946 domain-containing protein n=1 Tax=Marininema mesophilum TaxID=1048340 RepID=A0A1H2UFL1_9BACL|nr:Vps62-related protein [Marininema mesophilum]SDW54916.1 protein of unknown function [Marininema mesophilum]